MSVEKNPQHNKQVLVEWEKLNNVACEANWILQDYEENINKPEPHDSLGEELDFAERFRKALETIAKIINPIVDAR